MKMFEICARIKNNMPLDLTWQNLYLGGLQSTSLLDRLWKQLKENKELRIVLKCPLEK